MSSKYFHVNSNIIFDTVYLIMMRRGLHLRRFTKTTDLYLFDVNPDLCVIIPVILLQC